MPADITGNRDPPSPPWSAREAAQDGIGLTYEMKTHLKGQTLTYEMKTHLKYETLPVGDECYGGWSVTGPPSETYSGVNSLIKRV